MSQTTIAGRYLLAAQVDHTADGAVIHQATDRILTRPVSVTLLPEHRTAQLRSAGTVEHRHLLPVHEVGIHNRTAYLVSEPYAERDLFDTAGLIRIADPSFVRSLVNQLAAALDALAGHRLVHLGLDPLAVRLHPSIHPADPGTVRLGRLHALQPAGTTGLTPLAEPSYVPPELEVAAGDGVADPAIGPAADRWALAAVAFTLLTGQAPFPVSDAMSRSEIAKVRAAKAAGEVPPVASVRPLDRRPVPPAVDAVLRRAMAPDPAGRPPSAIAFAEAFGRACDEVAPIPERVDQEEVTGSRKKVLVAVGALVLLLVAGVAGWMVLGRDDTTETSSKLPEEYQFVQAPLADGCGSVEPAEARFGGAADMLRCASSGAADQVELIRYDSVEERDHAVDRLLDARIDMLVPCSDPPLAPDGDRPTAQACFRPRQGGAELMWSVAGRPILATASTTDGTPETLEVWLRQVVPGLIEEG